MFDYCGSLIKIHTLIDDEKCFDAIRKIRWPYGVHCPRCRSNKIRKQGHKRNQPYRHKYQCMKCRLWFDDLTGTVFVGHHQPIRTWIMCLYLMGLNLSNQQIAQELDLNKDDCQEMTDILRNGVNETKPKVKLFDDVECDEVYIIAGHKGYPIVVKKLGRKGRRNRLKGERGRGTLEKEKPPIFGMIQRNGDISIMMLANVKQETIEPLIRSTIVAGSHIFTDEYDIYYRLSQWGYSHSTVCHANGEYARDDDGDGFHEVHVNTIEGFWSLLRSWLRPHRGISQEKLPIYLGFFEYVHNVRRRGKAVLGSLLGLLLVRQPAVQNA